MTRMRSLRNRGQAMVEFAIVLPFLMLVHLTILYFGFALEEEEH